MCLPELSGFFVNHISIMVVQKVALALDVLTFWKTGA
jgi:hypothetical protein